MAGQHERGRKPSSGTPLRGDTESEKPAARRRARATNAPPDPRVTNLIPAVHAADDERTPATRGRLTAAPRLTNAPRLIGDTGISTSIPRHTSGTLQAASAAPEAPRAPTNARTTGSPAGSSSSRMRKTLPPETVVLPALPESADLNGDPDSSGSRIRRRRTSTARPVRPEDSALVERQTMIMQALEIVREDARIATGQLPAIRESAEMVIVDADPAPRAPVTVVPAGAIAPTPEWLRPRRTSQRGLVAGFVTCLITLGLILGVLQAASPLSMAQGSVSPFGLLAAQNASNTAMGNPTGPWDTQSGLYLGLGGGAGPGVKAPGSAGLPVGKSSSPSSPPTSSPPPKTSTAISPPPVYPWPPRWAYMYVPGHPAFAVSRPANGYYWWAFGQCTWWAQYKRQDENLRRMGNARYWAAGAASRGYRVGRIPAAGATVVFQPGVEGAGGAGHVAHVEKVYPGGWFLISEMNFFWNGGGWGRVDYRFAYARSGVSFIY